jgi:hypothetical protein
MYLSWKLSCLQIVKLVDDDTILSTTNVDTYLEAIHHTSFNDFFKLLVQAIAKLGLKKDKVHQFIGYI